MVRFFFFFCTICRTWCMDSFLFPTCFYFRWSLNNSVQLFMYYFSDMHRMYPFDGTDNAEVGYCMKMPSRNAHTYLIMYFFPPIQGKIKAVNGKATTKAVFCFKNKCWIASLNEMWSQRKGGEVVGIAVELTRMSNAEQILHIWQYRSEKSSVESYVSFSNSDSGCFILISQVVI